MHDAKTMVHRLSVIGAAVEAFMTHRARVRSNSSVTAPRLYHFLGGGGGDAVIGVAFAGDGSLCAQAERMPAHAMTPAITINNFMMDFTSPMLASLTRPGDFRKHRYIHRALRPISASRTIAAGLDGFPSCSSRHSSTAARNGLWQRRPTNWPLPVVTGRPRRLRETFFAILC